MPDDLDAKRRREAVERLLDEAEASGVDVTDRQLADHLHVSTKTIQRDRAWLKEHGRKPKPRMSADALAIVHDHNLNTLSLIDQGLKRLSSELEDLHTRMGFDGDECPTCGCKALDLNALLLTAKFKGEDSFNNQVTTRAKLLGELIENHVITVQQRDEDVALMMRAIVEIGSVDMQDLIKQESFLLPDGSVDVSVVTKALMRRIRAKFVEQSARRAARLPTPGQIIEAASREV